MNEAQAVIWLNAAKTAKACDTRLAPYEIKAAQGNLKISDLAPDDAIWMLAVVKDIPNSAALKAIAKKSALGSFVSS